MLMTKGIEGVRDEWVGGRNERRKEKKRSESMSLCRSCCIPHRSSLMLSLLFSLLIQPPPCKQKSKSRSARAEGWTW